MIREVVCVKVHSNPGLPSWVPELGIDTYS